MECTRLLEEHKNPLAADPTTLEQCVIQADLVIDDIIRALEWTPEEPAAPGPAITSVAAPAGGHPATADVHPAYSLQAAGFLFDVVFKHAAKALPNDDEASACLTTIALAMNHSLSGPLRAAFHGYLLKAIRQAQADERRRIARDLHDRIGHGVCLAIRKLDMLETYCHTNAGMALDRATDARRALAEALEGVRQLTTDLRQVTVGGSLQQALRTYLDEAGPGLTASVVVTGDEGRVEPNALHEVFLVMREALRNAVTHSNASTLVARVDIEQQEIRGRVSDDGVGITSQARARSTGNGLASAEERTRLLGGLFTVHSCPEASGTTIEIVVPLPDKQCHVN
ncbi:hypothetical protein J5X84_24885 [Streptosporangiaceae bacterium NEAU-GS5]|nr:hypothetical protein [Streptosporangiaceae bacterium NEAU-GS5]